MKYRDQVMLSFDNSCFRHEIFVFEK